MAQRHQRGWLKKETRSQGETWVLSFRKSRKSDGKRVENKIPIGLVNDHPDKENAWAEIERLHLSINEVNSRRRIIFATWHNTMPSMNWLTVSSPSTRRRTRQLNPTNE